MWYHCNLNSAGLKNLLVTKQIQFGGNARLKIYGTLSCSSGKRMLKSNRVFFTSENKAREFGYRPCGHCLHEKYTEWKNKSRKNQVENRKHLPHL